MLISLQFGIFILVSWVPGGILTETKVGFSVPPNLNEVDAMLILSTQSTLRKYLVQSLSSIQEKIVQNTEHVIIIKEILHGLQSRNLDPLKQLGDLRGFQNNKTTNVQKLARVIHKLQACNRGISLENWTHFLQSIPKHTTITPIMPVLTLTEAQLQGIQTYELPYVTIVVLGIRKNYLKLTAKLLGDILYNYPFRNYSPDVGVILNDLNEMLHLEDLSDFRISANVSENSNEILSEILKYILKKQKPGLTFQINQILAALSNFDQAQSFKLKSPVWDWLNFMREDEYPPDVIRAKNELVDAIKSNQMKLDFVKLHEELKSYSPFERVLGLISKLILIPENDPLSPKVLAIYPHVKMRYLANNEKFFQPQTTSDFAFLLNSFLALDIPNNPSLIKEIHKIFLSSCFEWEAILKNFDYSKYSKPRTLMMDILQELLNGAEKLPDCDVILFNYFLNNNSLMEESKTGDIPTMRMPSTSVLKKTQETSYTPPVTRQCPDGPPQLLIDPASIIEIIDSDSHTNFIADLIRYNPIPADKYSNNSRMAVFKSLLENLKAIKHNDSVPEFVINQALNRVTFNHKKNLPPTFVYLCPSELVLEETLEQKPENITTRFFLPSPPLHSKMPIPTTVMSSIALTPFCENPVLIIEPNSIIDIAKQDPNYNRIKQIAAVEPIYYEFYKAYGTREQVLRAVLERKRRQSINPVEQYDITQLILRLMVSQDGQLQPLVFQECLSTKTKPPVKNCWPGRLRKVIHPNDLIDIIVPVDGFQLVRELITYRPIPLDLYGQYSTRGEIYKAVLADRSREFQQRYFNIDVNNAIWRIPINKKAAWPATVIEMCEPPIVSADRFPPLHCNANEELKQIIDPNSLLEIIDDENIKEIKELLFKVMILAEKYLILGNRGNILLYFLRQHYMGHKGNVINPKLLGVSLGLHINEKGNLFPVVRDACTVLVKDPASTQVTSAEHMEAVLSPANTSSEYVVLENTTARILTPGYTNIESMAPNISSLPFSLPPVTISPEVDQPQPLIPPKSESCQPNKIPIPVYDVESVLDALNSSAPNNPFILDQIKMCLIPYDGKVNHTKAEILEIILDALSTSSKDRQIINDLNILKSHVLVDGPGLKEPHVKNACLPKEEVRLENDCLENETSISVVNTDTIFRALSPKAPSSPYIKEKLKSFIFPVDVHQNYTKAEILKNILNLIERDTTDLKIKEDIHLKKAHILDTGPGLEKPDVVQVCVLSTIMQKIQNATSSHPEIFLLLLSPLVDPVKPAASEQLVATLQQSTLTLPTMPIQEEKTLLPQSVVNVLKPESKIPGQSSSSQLAESVSVSMALPTSSSFVPITLTMKESTSSTILTATSSQPRTLVPVPIVASLPSVISTAPSSQFPLVSVPIVTSPSPSSVPAANLTASAPELQPKIITEASLSFPFIKVTTSNTMSSPFPKPIITTLIPLTNSSTLPQSMITTTAPKPSPPPSTQSNILISESVQFPMTSLATGAAPSPPPNPSLPDTVTTPTPLSLFSLPLSDTTSSFKVTSTIAPNANMVMNIAPSSPPPFSVSPVTIVPEVSVRISNPDTTIGFSTTLSSFKNATPTSLSLVNASSSSLIPAGVMQTKLSPVDLFTTSIAPSFNAIRATTAQSFSGLSFRNISTLTPLSINTITASSSSSSQPIITSVESSSPTTSSSTTLMDNNSLHPQTPAVSSHPITIMPTTNSLLLSTSLSPANQPIVAMSISHNSPDASSTNVEYQPEQVVNTPATFSKNTQISHLPFSKLFTTISPETVKFTTDTEIFSGITQQNFSTTSVQIFSTPSATTISGAEDTTSQSQLSTERTLVELNVSAITEKKISFLQEIQPATIETIHNATEKTHPANLINATTESTLAYITKPEISDLRKAEVVFDWPIILKPKFNETCYDKTNQNHTIPIQIVNVTSLFEILTEEPSQLDRYLTTAYLTSLDSYYKLYDFEIDDYKYKNTFLHDVLIYLLSFNRKLETEDHIRRILGGISFTNNSPLLVEVICNRRIFEELPKRYTENSRLVTEIFFRYDTLTHCQGKGFVSYNIGSSLKSDMPPEVQQTVTDFFEYSNEHKLFEGYKWEEVATQRDLVSFLLKVLEKQVLNENQKQATDYLYQHLKCDVLRFIKPKVFKECLVPDNRPNYFLKFKTADICEVEDPFNPTNITYYLDVFSLFKTLTKVQPKWMNTLVPILTNPNTLQKIRYPFINTTKGNFFREILKRLAAFQEESLPISTIHEITKAIDRFGYAATPVEMDNNCPTLHTVQYSRFTDKTTLKSCNLTEIGLTKMGKFIQIQPLLDSFNKNTSEKMLNALREIFRHPNIHTLLPKVENVRLTYPQFLQQALVNLKGQSSPLMAYYFNELLSQVNKECHDELVLEKMCQTPVNTNGDYLIYPSTETCEYRNFDLDISKLLEAFHPNISQNQIITLAAFALTKNQDFYDILTKLNINEFKTFGELLYAMIQAARSDPAFPVESFMQTLKGYIKRDSPSLSILTACSFEPLDLGSVINEEKLKEILQNPGGDELSFRMFDFSDHKVTDENFKSLENAFEGEKKLKENLYLLFGGLEKYTTAVETLQITSLTADRMYEAFDIIKALPDEAQTELLLRRYISRSLDEEAVVAANVLVNALDSPSRTRQVEDFLNFNLTKILSSTQGVPRKLLSKANISLSMNDIIAKDRVQDIIPYVANLKNREQLVVILIMIYKSQSAHGANSDTIRQLYNFLSAEEKSIPDVRCHYNNVIRILKSFTKGVNNSHVQNAMEILEQHLRSENYEDERIRKLTLLQSEPKRFLTASLKRFRELKNKKHQPEAVSVWLASDQILEFLEFDCGLYPDKTAVEVFTSLTGPTSVVTSKGAILKYMIKNRKDIEDVFEDLDNLKNFCDEEKMLIIVKRLLAKTGNSIRKELLMVAQYIQSFGYEMNGGLLETSMKNSIEKNLETSFSESQAFLMSDKSEVFENVARNLINTDSETLQQQILQQTYRTHAPMISSEELLALNATLKRMNINLENSTGDFTPRLHFLVRKSLPQEMAPELETAFQETVRTIEHHKLQLQRILKEIRIYSHPVDLRGRIVLLGIKSLQDLTQVERHSVDTVWNYADVSVEEVLGETCNESRKAKDILNTLLVNPPPEIVKEKEVILECLAEEKHRKLAYKGIRNSMQNVDVLVKILSNIAKSLSRIDQDVISAANTILSYLEIPLELSIPTETHRTLKIVQNLENTFEGYEGEVRQALENLTRYINIYPCTFDRILLTVPSTNHVVDVLQAVLGYDGLVSSRARTAALVLYQFLVKDEHLHSKKYKRSRREKFTTSNLDDEEKFEALKKASLWLLDDYE